MTTTRKQPQDRLPKKDSVQEEMFTFTHRDEEYQFNKPISEVVTPGLMRRSRHDLAELTWQILEQCTDEETLKVFDTMTWTEFRDFETKLGQAVAESLGASLGE